jgi:hypothetical protein
MTSSELIIEYAKSTQNVSICIAVSALLILCVMLLPLNKFIMKILIIVVLMVGLFMNFDQTNKFSNEFNINMLDYNWTPIKSNVICSYIFSLFILILIISVFRNV